MAKEKAYVKVPGFIDDPDMGRMPDFREYGQGDYAEIASDETGWLGMVCRDSGVLGQMLMEPDFSVWLIAGDEDWIANVIAEAEAMGRDEAAVRAADVYCEG